MATLWLLEILSALVCFLILRRLGSSGRGLPTNWPLVGMLPTLLSQLPRIHDWSIEIGLRTNFNFVFCGPWFSGMDMLVTADPANVHHIMSTNFVNYPKGSEFKRIFDIFGDGIVNVDHELWREERRVTALLLSHRNFHRFLAKTSRDKVQNLTDALERASTDLFQRFAFDSICKLVTGFDSGSISGGGELQEVQCTKALDDAEEAIFYRHVLPEFLWKLQRWMGIGEEKKLSRAWKSIDCMIAKYIGTKREELRLTVGGNSRSDEDGCDLLTSYMSLEKDERSILDCNDDKFLRDMALSLLLAGTDTTASALTWFFWNLSKHPSVETKIREEIRSVGMQGGGGGSFESGEFTDKLVYLHAAICESLRLYPPVPFQHKSPVKPDVLPSGHRVQARSRILFSHYLMARMPSVWGEDCSEFRPERWVSEKGSIRHVPSYKFMAFNSGPRTCLGKEIALRQMKAAVATVISNFHVQVEEGQDVRPRASIILFMKSGLKARVSRRSSVC